MFSNFFEKIRNNIFIFLIILSSFLISIIGVDYGLPFVLVSDEESLVGGALRMFELKQIFPIFEMEKFKILNYPTLLPYLYVLSLLPFIGGVFFLNGSPDQLELSLLFFMNIDSVWLHTRVISEIFAVLTTVVIYRISRLIFEEELSVIVSTSLFTFEYYHYFLAHFSRHWSATVFFIWLSVLFCMEIYYKNNNKYYNYLGVSTGLGFATSYIGSLGLIPIFFIQYIKQNKNSFKSYFSPTFMKLGAIVLGIVLVTIIINPISILRYVNPEGILPTHHDKSLSGFIGTVAFYMKTLFYADPVILIFSFISVLALMFYARYNVMLICVISFISYLAFLYIFLPNEDRYIMPILPVLCLLGAYSFEVIGNNRIKKVVTILFVVAMIYPVTISIKMSSLLATDDTRIQATKWLKKNIDKETIIIDSPTFYLVPTKTYIAVQKKLYNGKQNKFFNIVEKIYAKNIEHTMLGLKRTFNVVNLNENYYSYVKKANIENIKDHIDINKFLYYVTEYRSDEHRSLLYQELIKSGLLELVKVFSPSPKRGGIPPYLHSTTIVNGFNTKLFQFDRLGPLIYVYKIKK